MGSVIKQTNLLSKYYFGSLAYRPGNKYEICGESLSFRQISPDIEQLTTKTSIMLRFLILVAISVSVGHAASVEARGPAETCHTIGQLMADNTDCGAFYECIVSLRPVRLRCEQGLLWNDSVKRCDWPENVVCVH